MKICYAYLLHTLALFVVSPWVAAATVEVKVTNNQNQPIENAVVYATPTAGLSKAEKNAGEAQVDQIDKEFIPHISVVQRGARVDFPNHDRIRHHVYSFSDAKTFEIPLYKGRPVSPIAFDKKGVVDLGCNIHDWMSGYVFVTDTPYYAMTDKRGKLSLADLPDGEYELRVWHPDMKEKVEDTSQTVRVSGKQTASFQLTIKKRWVPYRAPAAGGGSYR